MSIKSRSLSDSVDLGSLHITAVEQRQFAGDWIDRVNRLGEYSDANNGSYGAGGPGGRKLSPPPPPPGVPPQPTPRSPMPPCHAGLNRSAERSKSATLAPSARSPVSPSTVDAATQGYSPSTPSVNRGRNGPRGSNTSSMFTSHGEYTPTASRLPADLTAVGSPILPRADHSDAAEPHGVVSRLRSDSGNVSPYVPRPTHAVPQPCPFGNEASSMASEPTGSPTSFTSALVQALSMSEGTAQASATQQSLVSGPPYNTTAIGDGGRAGDGPYSDEEEDDYDSNNGRCLDLYEHAMRVRVAKEQWVSTEKARRDALEQARIERDCPFQPRVSPYAAGIQRPAELRPEKRAHGEMLRRRQWAAMKKQEAVEQQMGACTFRPLTLRTARLDQAGQPRSDSQVFSELYNDAEGRRYFHEAVQPQLVDVMERHVLRQGPAAPVMRPEEIAQVVERLCKQGAVVAATDGNDDGGFRPQLAAATKRIVEQMARRGERAPDVMDDLYGRGEAARLERELETARRAEADRVARQAALTEREAARERLEVQRFRTLLAAKYVALARRACKASTTERRAAFRPKGPHSVVGLARAALDVLSPDETEEVLAGFEHCGVSKVTEGEFVFLMLRHAMGRPRAACKDSGEAAEAGAGAEAGEESESEAGAGPSLALVRDWRRNPLFTEPPPPPPQRGARTGSRGGNDDRAPRSGSVRVRSGSVGAAAAPPPLPPVLREKADPEVLERVRVRREAQMLEWREEARRRAELAEHGDPDYRPEPRRLIPYECRPDVHVPTRTNRAAQLREAHAKAAEGSVDAAADAATVDMVAHAPAPTARPLFIDANSTADGQRRKPAKRSVEKKIAEAPAHRGPVVSQSPQPATPPPDRHRPTPVPAPAVADRQPVAPAVPQTGGPRGQRADAPDRLYQGVIAEHAAFGGEEALMELGRELLLRQLQEYQQKRTAAQSRR